MCAARRVLWALGGTALAGAGVAAATGWNPFRPANPLVHAAGGEGGTRLVVVQDEHGVGRYVRVREEDMPLVEAASAVGRARDALGKTPPVLARVESVWHKFAPRHKLDDALGSVQSLTDELQQGCKEKRGGEWVAEHTAKLDHALASLQATSQALRREAHTNAQRRPWAELLGGTTIRFNKTGKEAKWEEGAKGKVVALFFGAGWCSPCRRFCPFLADAHATALAQNLPFEVVYVSWDNTPQQMEAYTSTTQGDWGAVAFAQRDVREELTLRCDVAVIPTVVVLDCRADPLRPVVLDDDARQKIWQHGAAAVAGWVAAK